jgi:hypothetical protein
VALAATTGADLFADRQPFREQRIRSVPEGTSLVCSNNERITAQLVLQATLVGLINSIGRQYGCTGRTCMAQSAVMGFTG